MKGRTNGPAGVRLYRTLLLLLPAAFRARHGRAMQEAFLDLYQEARGGGTCAVARLWLKETFDLCRSAMRLRSGLRVEQNRAAHMFRTFRDDASLARRATTRRPAFLLLAAVTLALGVGATTAMYSALKAVVLDPLPFREPERLVVPWQTMGSEGAMIGLEASEVRRLEAAPGLFEAVEEYGVGSATLTGVSQEPAPVLTMAITPGLPTMLGMSPLLGRVFSPEEVAGQGSRVLLISHALWRSAFGGRTDVVGRSLTVNGQGWTIIGVMPRRAARPNGDPRPVDLCHPGSGE
jgi:hypothetical protein